MTKTQTETAFAGLLERLKTDLDLYCEHCLQIRDKAGRLRPLKLNKAQRMTQEKLVKQLRSTGRIRAVILKARQEGISTLTAARFFRAIHLIPGIQAVVVADTLERAGVLYDIYDRFYQNLPEEIKPARKAVERRRYMAFDHDSSLSVRSANDTEAGRAMTILRLHASEIAFWGDRARETWISLMQAVPHDRGEVIVESTAKGAGGLFHELWENAEQPDSEWIPIFLPWWIHEEYQLQGVLPELEEAIRDSNDEFEQMALKEGLYYEGQNHILTIPQLAWRRAVIAEKFGGDPLNPTKDVIRAFQQEFPATAEEAFLISGACFFDEDALRTLARQARDPETTGKFYVDDHGDIRIDASPKGYVRLYEPPTLGGHYVIGADTAEGRLVAQRVPSIDKERYERGGRDYSCALVLKVPTSPDQPPKVVAELHGPLAPEIFADQLRLLGRFYSCGVGQERRNALIAVERSHSSGQTVLRFLREHYKYVPLYWAREINKRTRLIGKRLGWITDATTRQPMLDELAAYVRSMKIQLPVRELIREMVTFVRWPDGKPMAEEGCHDDRVIALAIAVQMLREHRHGYGSIPAGWRPSDSPTGL